VRLGGDMARSHISAAVDWTAERDPAILKDVESGAQLRQHVRRAQHLRHRERRADVLRETDRLASPD
jgi:hypothetical protein